MTYEEQINRLTAISLAKPLMPETYIPWSTAARENERFMSEDLVSLYDLPAYKSLTEKQKSDLGRHEITQVMFSYSWTEALLSIFLARYLTKLEVGCAEYNFIVRLIIEEYRHQEMFARGIKSLGGEPIHLTRFHRWVGIACIRYNTLNGSFLSILAIEMIADRYGDLIRKDKTVYPVIQKIAELHGIEEARHILFSKLFLEKRIKKAGYIRRTWYSYVVLLNIWYMRSLYVKKEIYQRIGADQPKVLYKNALKTYKQTFAKKCVEDIIPFVESINGMNRASRWAWRLVLKVKFKKNS